MTKKYHLPVDVYEPAWHFIPKFMTWSCPQHYTVSKNVPPLVCYNFDTHEHILILFWQKCY